MECFSPLIGVLVMFPTVVMALSPWVVTKTGLLVAFSCMNCRVVSSVFKAIILLSVHIIFLHLLLTELAMPLICHEHHDLPSSQQKNFICYT